MVKFAEHWTDGSIFCYLRQCECDGCYTQEIMDSPCQMKKAVFELLNKFGKPEIKKNRKTELQQNIIDLILKGENNCTDISKILHTSVSTIHIALQSLYELSKEKGFNADDYGRVKFYAFVEWLRKSEEV